MSRNSVLRDHYDLLDRGNELDRYPFAGFGSVPNFGYRLAADDCVDTLERELFLLRGELKRRAANESPKDAVRAAQFSEPGTSQAGSERTTDVSSLITARKAAEVLGLPLQRVYELARTGVLPAVRLGRQLRFDPTSLPEFVRSGRRRSE